MKLSRKYLEDRYTPFFHPVAGNSDVKIRAPAAIINMRVKATPYQQLQINDGRSLGLWKLFGSTISTLNFLPPNFVCERKISF